MKRLLKVTAMTGVLTVLKMVMGFVIAKVVAIYTGPTGLAMLGQFQSVVSSLNGIVNSPVSSGLVRYTAEQKENGFEACSPWWRASLQWVVIISILTIPFGLMFADDISIWLFQDNSLAWVVIVAICVLPFSALGTLCNSVINGMQFYRRYVVLGMISALISGLVMVFMIIMADIKGALLAASIQAALIGVVMIIANMRQPWFKLKYWWGTVDNNARKSIGGYILMAMTSTLTVPISLIFIRNILIDHVGWDITGHWQAVWRISEVYITVITMALGTYYLPRLASLVGVDAIIKEINQTAKVVIPIIVLLSLIVYFLRDILITILFTDEFMPARELFAIQLMGNIVKITSWLYAYPMLARGAVKWFVSTELFFSCSLVLLSYVLISHYNVQGANYAYLINYCFYFAFVFLNLKRFSK